MNLKQFLKPNWIKVLISLLLIIIAAFFTFAPYVSFIIFPFYFAAILFYNIPIYFTIIIFVLVSYPLGCYIAKNRKWLKGILFYLIIFLIISGGITFSIFKYNAIFGHSCNSDIECKFKCGAGAINYKFIYLKDPWAMIDCAPTIAICENNKCKTLSPYKATSIEDCEKIKQKMPQWVGECYFYLAIQLKDSSLCNKVDEISRQEQCIEELKEIK